MNELLIAVFLSIISQYEAKPYYKKCDDAAVRGMIVRLKTESGWTLAGVLGQAKRACK